MDVFEEFGNNGTPSHKRKIKEREITSLSSETSSNHETSSINEASKNIETPSINSPSTSSSASVDPHLEERELLACRQLIQLQSGAVTPLKLNRTTGDLWSLNNLTSEGEEKKSTPTAAPSLTFSFQYNSGYESVIKTFLTSKQQIFEQTTGCDVKFIKNVWAELAIRFMKLLFAAVTKLRCISSDGPLSEMNQIYGLYDLLYEKGRTKFHALHPEKKIKIGEKIERECNINCHLYSNNSNDIVFCDVFDDDVQRNKMFYNKIQHHHQDIMSSYFNNIRYYVSINQSVQEPS